MEISSNMKIKRFIFTFGKFEISSFCSKRAITKLIIHFSKWYTLQEANTVHLHVTLQLHNYSTRFLDLFSHLYHAVYPCIERVAGADGIPPEIKLFY